MSGNIIVVAHTGTGGERGRIVSPDGIAVSLKSTDYKDPPKIIVEHSKKEKNGGSINIKHQR